MKKIFVLLLSLSSFIFAINDDRYTIFSNRVGKIFPGMSVPDLKNLGYKLVFTNSYPEGVPSPIIIVFVSDTNRLFCTVDYFHTNKISGIAISDARFSTEQGFKVGTRVGDIFKKIENSVLLYGFGEGFYATVFDRKINGGYQLQLPNVGYSEFESHFQNKSEYFTNVVSGIFLDSSARSNDFYNRKSGH